MKKLFAIILAGLFLPVFCFGTVIYERNPSGYTISNPVTFNLEWEQEDFCPLSSFWRLLVTEYPEGYPTGYYSNTQEIVPINQIAWEVNLPEGLYNGVYAQGSVDGEAWTCVKELEYNDDDPIFEVVGEEIPLYNILPVANISGILAFAGRLFTDLQLLILLAIGLPVGFWIINKAIGIVTRRTKTRS